MAHGKNAANKGNHRGHDWWGKRPLSGLSVSAQNGMKWDKRYLHSIERQESKKVVNELENLLQSKNLFLLDFDDSDKDKFYLPTQNAF